MLLLKPLCGSPSSDPTADPPALGAASRGVGSGSVLPSSGRGNILHDTSFPLTESLLSVFNPQLLHSFSASKAEPENPVYTVNRKIFPCQCLSTAERHSQTSLHLVQFRQEAPPFLCPSVRPSVLLSVSKSWSVLLHHWRPGGGGIGG